MDARRTAPWSRRQFLSGLSATGVMGLDGSGASPAAAEPPPETSRLVLLQFPSLCVAPQYVAEEMLRAEGFTDIQYPRRAGAAEVYKAIAEREANLTMGFVGPAIVDIDAGAPLTLLAGVHAGCYEVFGTDRIRTIRDFKGKTIAVQSIGGGQHLFLASMFTHVGLDPRKDVRWVAHPPAEGMRLLAEGKVDGYLGFPPEPQELRARKIGRVIVNTALDRPWSQYFCCLIIGHREFVQKHPIATKRAIRAILKAADVCALDPDRAARGLVEKGYEERYEYALQVMREIPYARWREYTPEDTVRFYALRLHEGGFIKSTPQRIIAQGTDWRFLNELKKELKG